jgi:hypothetical protein
VVVLRGSGRLQGRRRCVVLASVIATTSRGQIAALLSGSGKDFPDRERFLAKTVRLAGPGSPDSPPGRAWEPGEGQRISAKRSGAHG